MKKICLIIPVFVIFMGFAVEAMGSFKTDTLKTSQGDLEITFIGHGSLMFTFKGIVIHVDPFGRLTDYSKLPKANVILITHDHRDHFDTQALEKVRTDRTTLVLTINRNLCCQDKRRHRHEKW
jgi:hypothetical protein